MFTPTDRRAAYAISSPLLILLWSSYILFLHHVLPILHICFVGARFGQRAYAQGLDNMIIVQVVRPPIRWTSLLTNWSECLALTPSRCSIHRRLVGWTAQRMGFIVSYAGGSPATLGTPRCLDSSCKRLQLSWGLPWWSDLATSHRCAIKLLHAVWIRVLILGSKSGVLIRACQMTSASFQTSFYLTLL